MNAVGSRLSSGNVMGRVPDSWKSGQDKELAENPRSGDSESKK